MNNQIYIGKNPIKTDQPKVSGRLVNIENEAFYQINNFDEMAPFFITVVSDSDHWMYISSNGSLTAGRVNPEQAIFPYYTDDKIHDYEGITGSKTIILATINGQTNFWEPFSKKYQGIYQTKRSLFKNETGNKIIFEENNIDLGLSFRYCWMNSDRFGWIRKSTLLNHNNSDVDVQLVDGIQNILPYGVNRTMQGMLSTLVDAYKKTELVEDTSLGLFRLSSIPVDRAEPSEALKATTVWSFGLENSKTILSTKQLDHFCKGSTIETETENLGTKGAYFVNASFALVPDHYKSWYILAEVSQDSVQIEACIDFIKNEGNKISLLEADVERGTQNLIDIVAKADGLQLTSDQLNVKRHFANAMFNSMRGGVPFNDYKVLSCDFVVHVKHSNVGVYTSNLNWLNELEPEILYYDLIERLQKHSDADLLRLGLEYLPLMFSRRHGDPSRPWNLFNIKLKNSDGTPSLSYQGNWRDIFQNWEALAMSYPDFLPGMIAKFLNASTIDGYNAYKITREGIEWEVMDPDDPWSNIGYWGDHQIIYLEKLLELSEKFYPGKLEDWFTQSIFTYANVPYRHKTYEELIQNPHDAIAFDQQKHDICLKLEKEIGSDGKLIQDEKGTLKANLIEKLLVPLYSKLSNFVPEAGIWMNTQRPEWNDANNALVGIGASMVTLYYMRRYVSFLERLINKATTSTWTIHAEVKQLFSQINQVFFEHETVLQTDIDDLSRKTIMDALGKAGSAFRSNVYDGLSGAKDQLEKAEVIKALEKIKLFIDHSITRNKRSDGLFHAYNLILIQSDNVGIRRLNEMLEGQVSVLSSGYLNADQTLELLNKLRASKLYRNDQQSYILYPNKKLPNLLDKNKFTTSELESSKLLQQLLEQGNTDIILKDHKGIYHFNGEINNASKLAFELNQIESNIENLDEEKKYILDLYEKLFDHESFTGRSGTFYKFEGLGCIYWHMVSKLLLAVAENISLAEETSNDLNVLEKLKEHYKQIRNGIGSHKSPKEYGAFPTDPYSHTPSMSGVQQPGMTGQVKEDLLSRMHELGISVNDGCVHFEAQKVNSEEFITEEIEGNSAFLKVFPVAVPKGVPYLAFTYCNVPVIYQKSDSDKIRLSIQNKETIEILDHKLDMELSSILFKRKAEIEKIEVLFTSKNKKR